MHYNAERLGKYIRETRKAMGATQETLAMTAGTGLRFIVDLERGKPTCQLEKTLRVLHTLGIQMVLVSPVDELKGDSPRE